eukprot:3506369-Amphidinium_carterae.1
MATAQGSLLARLGLAPQYAPYPGYGGYPGYPGPGYGYPGYGPPPPMGPMPPYPGGYQPMSPYGAQHARLNNLGQQKIEVFQENTDPPSRKKVELAVARRRVVDTPRIHAVGVFGTGFIAGAKAASKSALYDSQERMRGREFFIITGTRTKDSNKSQQNHFVKSQSYAETTLDKAIAIPDLSLLRSEYSSMNVEASRARRQRESGDLKRSS